MRNTGRDCRSRSSPRAGPRSVFSKAAGVPITKSPKCGATGAMLVSAIQSSTSSMIRPVPRGMFFRLARGIAHAPVEADAVAIDAMAGLVERFPDFGPGAPALRRVAKADLGVHHDAAFRDASALVVDLARHVVGLEERRSADGHVLGHRAAFRDQRLRRREAILRETPACGRAGRSRCCSLPGTLHISDLSRSREAGARRFAAA